MHFVCCEANLCKSGLKEHRRKGQRQKRDSASLIHRKPSQEEIRATMSEPREETGRLGPPRLLALLRPHLAPSTGDTYSDRAVAVEG